MESIRQKLSIVKAVDDREWMAAVDNWEWKAAVDDLRPESLPAF